MFVLCCVLLAIAIFGAAADPNLQAEIPETSADIRLNGTYRLICVVNSTAHHLKNVSWYKGRKKLANQKKPKKSKNGTREVIYVIKRFGKSDAGKYHCKNKETGEMLKIVQLNYAPEDATKNEDQEETNEEQEEGQGEEQDEEHEEEQVQNHQDNTIPGLKTGIRYEILQPSFKDGVCKTVKNGNYKAEDEIKIPYPLTSTSTVLTMKIRITIRRQQYYPDPYYSQGYRHNHHGYNTRRRRPRQANETNFPTVADPISNEKTTETARQEPNNTSLHDKKDNDTSSPSISMNSKPSRDYEDSNRYGSDNNNINHNNSPGRLNWDIKYGMKNNQKNVPNNKQDRDKQDPYYPNRKKPNHKSSAVISKLLSIRNDTEESINVYIKTDKRYYNYYSYTTQKSLIVNGSSLKEYVKGIGEYVKIQLIYNNTERSTHMKLSGTTTTEQAIKNFAFLQIGNSEAQRDISIKHEDITICKLVKPTISLKVEVKENHVLLECTGTGPPFLTGVWKVGRERQGSAKEGTPSSQWEDAQEELVITHIIKPSSLANNLNYSCEFTSSAGGRAVRRIRIGGEEYFKEKRWNFPVENPNSNNDGNPWSPRQMSPWELEEKELSEYKNSSGKH